MIGLLVPGANIGNRRNVVVGLVCALIYGAVAGLVVGYALAVWQSYG